MIFPHQYPEPKTLRATMMKAYRMDESACLETLLKAMDLPQQNLDAISALAHKWIVEIRKSRVGKGGIDAFLYEFNLSGEEGTALMCLAEAMLRVPDSQTADLLIQDKITMADWESHIGKSESGLMNITTWGLMLTGKILTPQQSNHSYFSEVFKKLITKMSAPVIRKAVMQAMKIMGRQFVMGRTIKEAIKRSKDQEVAGYRFSYDMLGEAARTLQDAEHYYQKYEEAITAIGEVAKNKDLIEAPGICVKLSALHPRFEFAHREKSLPQLIEQLKTLCVQAKHYGIGLTIDAEEADRLDLTLDLFEALCADAALRDWDGLGLAVQAYQKRAYYVIDWLANIALSHKRRLMLRLVKGAYWDYEIKDTQVKGLNSYPVFTRKAATDVSYLACAKKMIHHKRAFYPQFGTHNAYTAAAIMEMMGDNRDFEFQCLKGMGRAMYDQLLADDKLNASCRIYAPVGYHQDLLPYLVRRLLENGANTSFVNRLADDNASIEELIEHPMKKISQLAFKPHPKIPLPADIFAPERKNSQGIDLSNSLALIKLAQEMEKAATNKWTAGAMVGKKIIDAASYEAVDPSNHQRVIGVVSNATIDDVDEALTRATRKAANWDRTPVEQRATLLERTADLFEQNLAELMALAVREAGKTIADALGEVREAVDFCRYYAALGRQHLTTKHLPGPTGESNQLQMHGRGVMLCISPWNFPLAIFCGQIASALVAGNCVIAKPAEQTPLIAAKAIELMLAAGIPDDVIQLLPGEGHVIGAKAVADVRINGVLFTGSTETARNINQTLANRTGEIVPLIAETGGQNALIADSTALPEQLVMDAITSAFNSAGQRCSALRVLFVQDEIADCVIKMLKGAMAELSVGDPAFLSTDIGPVIDKEARSMLEAHAERMNKEGKLIYQMALPKNAEFGTFFAPRAYEIDGLHQLSHEVFGPILHVIRYPQGQLDQVIESINNTKYGLTLGIQTRIDFVAEYIQRRVKVGNCYVNRNIIGAVVGVQPFGGEGLSGTGPKAGGPHYLSRLCHERTLTINTAAAGGNASLLAMAEE